MFRTLALTILLFFSAAAVQAQESLQHASDASGESVVATGRLSEAGVKVFGGSIAAPLVVIGSVAAVGGSAVADAGSDMWQSANEPLEVSPETLVGQPVPQVPNEAPKTQPVKAH
ncbi:hypothetical protein [Asticcacaulis taihuensis]|uniref:hypothetical protein n=1 Tax=Asticcacaulis taihuensis TaxID=260084 RepID=UPI0026E9B503|nr:hypothetical protein [Asticcacaulis taihuensis]